MRSAVDQAWRAMNEPDTAKIHARAPHINKILDGSTNATKSGRGARSSPLAKQLTAPLAWAGGLESKALGSPTSAFRRLQKGIPPASLDAAGGGGTASVSKGTAYCSHLARAADALSRSSESNHMFFGYDDRGHRGGPRHLRKRHVAILPGSLRYVILQYITIRAVMLARGAIKYVFRGVGAHAANRQFNAFLFFLLAEDSLSVDEVACNLLTSWLKNKNGVADSDVRIRKAAMQSLSRDLHAVVEQFGGTPVPEQNAPSADPPGSPTSFVEDLMSILMEDLSKLLFKGLTDPAEACR